MLVKQNTKRAALTVLTAAFSLLLTACLLAPGKFSSTLDLRQGGRFSFTYTGQISMLGLSKLAQMDRKADAAFEPEPCHVGDGGVERMCTASEVAEQRKKWDERRQQSADKAKKYAEQAKMLLGGIDPTSPRAAEEMAERLRKQAGWKSVIYKGDGLYEVDFAISGTLDHDFLFPTIERFPMANAFVVINRRADGTVRVDAPAFGPSNASSSGLSGLAAMAAMDKAKDGKLPVPELDGSFTITSDGQILANNTDDGPKAGTAGQTLTWLVSPRSTSAPTALIKLRP